MRAWLLSEYEEGIFCLNVLGTDLICGVRCQDNDYVWVGGQVVPEGA